MALLLAATVARASEPTFADVGVSKDARSVLEAHYQALFPGRSDARCVRGEATPWIDGRKLPEGRYAYRQVAPTTAIEVFARPDGANLTVVNWGCEYYVATIRYVFPAIDDSRSLVAHVYDALEELRRVGARSVFDLTKAAAALHRHGDLNGLLRSGDELPIAGDGEEFLQTRAVIMRVGAIRGGGFVEFRLVKGPL